MTSTAFIVTVSWEPVRDMFRCGGTHSRQVFILIGYAINRLGTCFESLLTVLGGCQLMRRRSLPAIAGQSPATFERYS